MSHYNADYHAKQRIIREIREACQKLLSRGINPTFVVQGLNAKESEEYFAEAMRILEGSRS